MANREDNETQQLLQIFPNEVWVMILEEVKDAQGFQTISNATSHFRQILHPRAPQILFPEVVKVLLDQLPTEAGKEEESDDQDEEEENSVDYRGHDYESAEEEIMEEAEQHGSADEADPEVELEFQGEVQVGNENSTSASRKSGKVERLNALRLRKVCHALRISVDQWLQAQDFYSKSKFEKHYPCHIFGMGYQGTFDYFSVHGEFGVEHIFRFEEHFDPTHFDLSEQTVNPFLSRGIYRKIKTFIDHVQLLFEPPDLELFYQACIQLLRKYGHHLWYCRIDLSIQESHDENEFFNRWLPTLLELMPNLRTLFVDGNVEDTRRIKLRNQRTPFPHLGQLNTITVERVPRHVVKALLQSNPQVQQVDVRAQISGDKTPRHVDSNKDCLELMPNLIAVALELHYEEAFKRFRSARVAGRVERLWLDAACLVEIPWQRIFRAVEFQFSDTLTQLCIRLPDGNKKGKIHQGLTLPNLKILKLICCDLEPLDYLLPMKQTLEQLSLEYRVQEYDERFDKGLFVQNEEKAVLKLYRFWSEPVRSTIWNHFPRLKRLETARTFWRSREFMDHYVCTR